MGGIRVAAVQFAVGSDVAANLAACLRGIAAAAARGARLVVLPEFVNHPDRYPDRAHAREVACRRDDAFLGAVAAAAAAHGCHVKLHVSLATGDRVTAANLLFDPSGELIARGDAQLAPGADGHWLDTARESEPTIDTPLGSLGMYSGRDGVGPEVPRALALRGVQVLLASMCTPYADDMRLHTPVRAAENRTWVIAANTIGPRPGIGHALAGDWLNNAGESCVIGPDGTVVARAPATGEAVVVADIEPRWADDKTRPDGSDLFLARRPRLYAPPTSRSTADRKPADQAEVAVVRPRGHGMSAIADAAELVYRAATDGADLVVLPELFSYQNGCADGSFLDGIAVDLLSQALDGSRCHVVTTLPDDSVHVGVLISAHGVRGRQPQLHASARHVSWQATLGDRLVPFDLDWGRLVIAVGDDSLYPETFRLAALLGADAVAVPCTPAERWELTVGLPARAAEHGLNIVAAAHAAPGGGGVIAVPAGGTRSRLTVVPVPADARLVSGSIHPAGDREPPAEGTYLVDGHPWRLAGVLGPAAGRR